MIFFQPKIFDQCEAYSFKHSIRIQCGGFCDPRAAIFLPIVANTCMRTCVITRPIWQTNHILYHSHPLNARKSVFVIPRVIRISNRTGSTQIETVELNCWALPWRSRAIACPRSSRKKWKRKECEKIAPPELP